MMQLWRSVKYEEVSLHDYASPRDARRGLAGYLDVAEAERDLHRSGRAIIISPPREWGTLCDLDPRMEERYAMVRHGYLRVCTHHRWLRAFPALDLQVHGDTDVYEAAGTGVRSVRISARLLNCRRVIDTEIGEDAVSAKYLGRCLELAGRMKMDEGEADPSMETVT